MNNISTGFGLCVLGLGIAAWPVIDRLMPQANAVGVISVAPAVAAAALAQDPPAPTIVWYGTEWNNAGAGVLMIVRAWSDGKLELKIGTPGCNANGVLWQNPGCGSGCPDCQDRWVVINNPAEGLTFDADLNFDEAVDGADLGELLAKWGPAPRNPVPPSDCPLALINP
jgi:hypothetical protein